MFSLDISLLEEGAFLCHATYHCCMSAERASMDRGTVVLCYRRRIANWIEMVICHGFLMSATTYDRSFVGKIRSELVVILHLLFTVWIFFHFMSSCVVSRYVVVPACGICSLRTRQVSPRLPSRRWSYRRRSQSCKLCWYRQHIFHICRAFLLAPLVGSDDIITNHLSAFVPFGNHADDLC